MRCRDYWSFSYIIIKKGYIVLKVIFKGFIISDIFVSIFLVNCGVCYLIRYEE